MKVTQNLLKRLTNRRCSIVLKTYVHVRRKSPINTFKAEQTNNNRRLKLQRQRRTFDRTHELLIHLQHSSVYLQAKVSEWKTKIRWNSPDESFCKRAPAPLFSTNRRTYSQDFFASRAANNNFTSQQILSLTIFPLHFVLLTMKLSPWTLDWMLYATRLNEMRSKYSKVFQCCLNSNCLNSRQWWEYGWMSSVEAWYRQRAKWQAHRTNCNAIILTPSDDNQVTPLSLMRAMKHTVLHV